MADNNPEPRAGSHTNRRSEDISGNVNVYERPEAPIFQRHPVPIIIISLAVLAALVLLTVFVL